ncbi:MAG: choice-of-anchor D domain-containing protein [Thermoanaerobaculia bacterium]
MRSDSTRALRAGFVLAAVALLLLAASLARAAEPACSVAIGSAVARPGDVVEIPLTLEGSGVSALALVVAFDAEQLVLDGGAHGGSKVDVGSPASVDATSWLLADESRLGIVLFDAEAPIDSIPEGVVAHLRFRVRPDATGPEAAVRIVAADLSASDADGRALVASVARDGAIAIATSSPALAVSASIVRFGSISPGETARQSVVAFNAGSGALRVTGAAIEGGDGAFAVASGVPRELHPGESLPLEITFTAGALGEYRGRLVIDSAGGGSVAVEMSAASMAGEFFLDRRLVVPAVARVNGAERSRWLSSLHAFNRGSSAVRFRATLLRAEPLPPLGPVEVDLEPGTTRSFDDAIGALFGDEDAAGALLIEASSDDLVVRSTTYNERADGSRVPQAVPAIEASRLFRTGETAHLVALERSDDRRTSITVMNLGPSPATLRVELLDSAGAPLATRDVTIAPQAIVYDVPVFEGVEAAGETTAVVRALTPDAVFFAYASTVDASSGAPLFQSPR